MSIQTEITRISGNVSNALTAISNKGVTVPSGSNSDDLATLIGQITGGGGSTPYVLITGEQDAGGGKVLHITGAVNQTISEDSGGGDIDAMSATVLLDLSDDTVDAAHLISGYTAHNSMGQQITGTASHGTAVLGTKTITTNGTYNASSDSLDGYSSVTVNVSSGEPSLQSKTVSPATSQQTVSPDTGYDGLSSVTVNAIQTQTKSATPSETAQTISADSGKYLTSVSVGAISSTYVGSDITHRSSSDLTASGATVTVPVGYYSAQASKAVASGSATTPAETITANPLIEVAADGTITATVENAKSITPTVSAGYISAGTAGYVSASGSATHHLSTAPIATITPTKSAQTAVAAGKYTTGAITVAAIPAAYQDVTGVTATASDVVSGKDIVNSSGTVVHGSLVIQHYYTSANDPTSSDGADGDIWLKVVS